MELSSVGLMGEEQDEAEKRQFMAAVGPEEGEAPTAAAWTLGLTLIAVVVLVLLVLLVVVLAVVLAVVLGLGKLGTTKFAEDEEGRRSSLAVNRDSRRSRSMGAVSATRSRQLGPRWQTRQPAGFL